MYHYANNNPVRYTDPDGKTVNLLTGDIKTERFHHNMNMFLNIINTASYQQFKVSKEGLLEIDEGNFNPNGSKYFSNDMIKAVKSSYMITFSFSSLLPENWDIEDGIDKNIKGGANYVFEANKTAYIFVSPSIWTVRDQNGNLHDLSYLEVVIHELSGHVIPKIEKRNGNAIVIENIIRDQLHIYLRKMDENHDCF